MARNIKITEIGDYCKGNLEQLLRSAVLQTDKRLKKTSPVDTGRFSASWQVGENAALGGIKPPGNYTTPAQIERLGYQQEKLGNIYSIHNNLPYAEALARGSSKKTSGALGGQGGWVEGIVKDMQGWVRENAARIGRES